MGRESGVDLVYLLVLLRKSVNCGDDILNRLVDWFLDFYCCCIDINLVWGCLWCDFYFKVSIL